MTTCSWKKSKGKKVHTRNIEVSTYAYDGQRIIVEGFLKDDRFQEFHMITGETRPGGVVHHMAIRLLVSCSNLLIEDNQTIAYDNASKPLRKRLELAAWGRIFTN